MTELTSDLKASVARRAKTLLAKHQHETYAHTDRLFAFLMALQWIAGVVAALIISPRTWSGTLSQVHIHVWTAVLVGGAISSAPIGLALLRPGRPSTRYVIAVAQMLTSALLIHLSGGRIEAHFHVFGSLAFLAFYRDWRVLVPATLVVALDHMIRGIFWSESVFGVVNASQWRWVEHATWVIFEDIFLIHSCKQAAREMRQIADRRAQLEATNEIVEAKVEEQTAEIRDREEIFRSLSASSPIGVFRYDTYSSRLTYANERCSRITGLSHQQIIDEGLTEVIHHQDRDQFLKDWTAASSTSTDLNREFRMITADGKERWIQIRTSPVDSDNASRVGTLEDITLRKLAAAREASFDRIFEESSNEIYIFDADTLHFVRVNRGGRDNTGYTMTELERLTPLDLKPEFTEPRFQALLAPLRRGERRTVVFDTIHRRKDGSTYPVEVRLQLSTLDTSPVFAGLILDVSAREQAEKERDRMMAAVEQGADSVVITNVEGWILYANPAYEAVTGFNRVEAIGTNLLQGEELRDENKALKATIHAGEAWIHQFTSERKDGTSYEAETTVSAIRETDGTITNFVAVTRDVTEKKSLEAQLGQAQKLESIGQLAAGIAHEINTPTQYVGDNTRFLQEAFGDLLEPLKKFEQALENSEDSTLSTETIEELRKSIEVADVEYLTDEIPRAIGQSLDGIERVTRIVRAMKEFSHPAVDKTQLDINQAIQSTVTVASNEWKYVAELETDLDETLGTIPAVPGEFNQVVLNMVVNASHAIADVVGDGGNGKGLIRVATKRLDEWAEIRISDSGCGIPAEIRERVFDQFFTTKEVGKGTGQGLSIAHTVVVKKHGGTLAVESEVGSGTTFIIRLPLIDPKPVEEEVTA